MKYVVEPLTHPIEGFYVEIEKIIMAVKGVLQPPGRVIALPTYIPLDGGFRRIRRLKESLNYFVKRHPEYYDWFDFAGRRLPAPPLDVVKKIYNPLSVRHVRRMPPEAEELKRILIKESGIDERFIGITGSTLLGRCSPKSDIDLIVYGIENGRRIYDSMKELRKRGDLRCLKDYYELRKSRSDSSLPIKDLDLGREIQDLNWDVFQKSLYGQDRSAAIRVLGELKSKMRGDWFGELHRRSCGRQIFNPNPEQVFSIRGEETIRRSLGRRGG
ncbi:hypothetical protein DRO02_07520 [archaeon]|nr:MAG: hypothetical protein DRO02_07520 [archaeon]